MKYYALGALLLVAVQANAVDCSYSKVNAIQAQTSNVLIRVTDGTNTAWKNLGDYTDQSLNSFQSVAQQALATGSSIVMRFPSGYDCKATDYDTVPFMIRINA